MKLKNSKGFLGPLGDDLPSLIPLLFALVIFFSAFTSAFNTFDKKNSAFQAELEVSSIAAKLVADSYIEGYDGFQLLCKKVTASDVKYKAGIIELPFEISEDMSKIDPLAPDFYYFPTEAQTFECPVDGENPTENSRNLMVRVYPIALELKDDTKIKIASGFIVRPMILVVVTWKD